uniref:DNAation factor subunit beta n=2 Tax=Cacopsylla melanoneura TaxID=428564 RepID=A0A8D9AFR6_9HEMI
MTVQKVKGFKVTDSRRTKMVGVAAKSFRELLTKCCIKFDVKKRNVKLVLLDGTLVENEDYFQTLPNQSVLLIQSPGEQNAGAELIYSTLQLINVDLLRSGAAVQKFFDHNVKEKLRQLNRIVNAGEEEENRTGLSERSEDPDWFMGLETNARTKEAFMFKRSQERIRGYLYKSRSDIRKSPPYVSSDQVRSIIESVFAEFTVLLKQDDYLGRYFDRSKEEALCDERGEFLCRGAWNQEHCTRLTLHRINPYQSREARIVFSTWNLDHWIERSRSIIPSILDASTLLATQSRPVSQFNHTYFYRLLFTTHNLKLVHIVCHDKGEHKTAKCDKDKYFVVDVDEPLRETVVDVS